MVRKTIRQFFGPFLDHMARMSQTPANYWGEFALDIPLGAWLVLYGLHHPEASPALAVFTFLVGLFLFSFVEYFFHRWLFHGSIPIMVEGHRQHHRNPLGYSSLPFFLPALVLLGLLALFDLLLPTGYAALLIGAVAFGYVAYGVGHFLIHHLRFRHRLALQWAGNHLTHHHHPTTNFGVTSPLWDRIFSTRFQGP
jgi:sterol desaturase/sphingolipid hydroxylase (fatty acid hydroxylase superfamily)